MKVRLKPNPNKDKIKIENHDLWNADDTLAKIIGPLIREFRKQEHLGTPGSLVGEGGTYEAHEEWLEILNHIEWSMNQIVSGDKFSCFTRETKPADTEGWKYIYLFGSGFWFNEEGYYKYHCDLQKGIDLLAKHFRDLWI